MSIDPIAIGQSACQLLALYKQQLDDAKLSFEKAKLLLRFDCISCDTILMMQFLLGQLILLKLQLQ